MGLQYTPYLPSYQVHVTKAAKEYCQGEEVILIEKSSLSSHFPPQMFQLKIQWSTSFPKNGFIEITECSLEASALEFIFSKFKQEFFSKMSTDNPI